VRPPRLVEPVVGDPRVSFVVPALPLSDAGMVFAVLTVAILLAPLLARSARVPEVVAFVLVGFAIGPTGLGLLERAGVVATLGGAGLLYLMFIAGVELDLDDFVAHRRDSVGFGILTFVVPMTLGTVVSLALGYDPLPALLIASCWASHTLIAYPTFQRTGTAGNRAVATSVGATIITDAAALLVLAIVARAFQGALTAVFWVTLVPSAVLVTVAVVAGLPRLATRFFAGLGQAQALRFVFVLASLFVVASAFQLIGIEAIVGAFLAGLALNRSVPNGGALMARLDFVGATLFVPLFLLATGMLIDLQVLMDPRTLLLGAAFTGVVVVAKLGAAWLSGRLFGYDRNEIGAMFALSAAQAAATLAAIVVGLQVGLIDTETVNAAMLVILATCVAASLTASRYAPRLERPRSSRHLGEVVVTPVANPATAPALLRFAAAFARTDGGLIVPLTVATAGGAPGRLTELRTFDDEVLRAAQATGAEADSVLRIDSSPQAGIIHTLHERRASLLVLGWKGRSGHPDALFGGIIDDVLGASPVPTLVVRDATHPIGRILVVIDASVTRPAGHPALRLALHTAAVTARTLGVDVVVHSNREDPTASQYARDLLGNVPIQHDTRRRSGLVTDLARPDDLVILPAMGDRVRVRALARRVLPAVPDGAGLVVAFDTSPDHAAGPTRLIGEPSVSETPADPMTLGGDTID
jgi:Kef-type K+ transport system membrane component KefB/nucleotide-binding universal stress UspA family protein